MKVLEPLREFQHREHGLFIHAEFRSRVRQLALDFASQDFQLSPKHSITFNKGEVTYAMMAKELNVSRPTLVKVAKRFGLMPIGKERKRGTPENSYDREAFLNAWNQHLAEQDEQETLKSIHDSKEK
jgi:hypothetical protein